MELLKIGLYIIFAGIFLALIPAPVAAASDNIPVPLIALDLFQNKSRTQYTSLDFQIAGDKAVKDGDFKEGINNYNKALDLLRADPPKSGSTADNGNWEFRQEFLEHQKSDAYSSWPGHDAEAQAAHQNAEVYRGQGRKKQMELHEEQNSCLIATATFGSPMAPQVQQLREFREENIYSTKSGTQFMTAFNAWYYSFSPAVANFIDDHPSTKPPMRIILTPLLGILDLAKMSFFALTPYSDIAVIIAGLVASTLIGMVYAFPVLFVLLVVIRRVYPFTFTTIIFKILGGFAVTGLVLLAAGGLLSLQPILLIGSVLFIVSLVLLTGLFLSWVCLNRLDSFSAHANTE
ncbi:MAG: CFI-box-CTERM domain-containing protein [Methanoregula sp.]|nr:CFI-box-CTERM domain-containing protein [Methanoregula sp.]